jgi:hypothetical protein
LGQLAALVSENSFGTSGAVQRTRRKFHPFLKENVMKKLTYITLILMLITVAGFSTARAQTGSNDLSADIPFAFHVGQTRFPAGEYTIRCTNSSSDRKVLELRRKKGGAGILIQTNSVIDRNKEGARLVFNRYGDRYYLSQAWMSADNIGMQALMSRHEQATANEMATIRRITEQVAMIRKR